MDIKRALNFIESRTTEKPVVTEIVNELAGHLNGLADKITSLEAQCEVYREALEETKERLKQRRYVSTISFINGILFQTKE